jgi:hypothetical protein
MQQIKEYLSIKAKDKWWLLATGMLFVGLAARFICLNADTLDYDSYSLMTDVDKSFQNFSNTMHSFGFSLRVHYWISYRLFGGKLSDFLIFPVIASLAALLIVYFGLNRFFNNVPGMAFVVLTLLAFNAQSIYLTRYAMFIYIGTFFVSIILYFIFLEFIMNIDARIAWYWSPIVMIAAFFSYFLTIVPLFAGVGSVFLYRLYVRPESRNLKHLFDYVKSIWPLIFFPLVYIIALVLQPPTNVGIDKRPDMAELFLYSSFFNHESFGFLKFILKNTVTLLGQILTPFRYSFLIIFFSIFIFAVVINWKSLLNQIKTLKTDQLSKSSPILFTLLYIFVIYIGIAGGGVFGVYPFGSMRYASYLLTPVMIVIAWLISWSLKTIINYIRFNKIIKKVFMVVPVLLIAYGIFIVIKRNHQYIQSNIQNKAVFNTIRQSDADLLLVSSYIPAPILRHFASEVVDKKNYIDMGWGTFFGHGSDGGIRADIKYLMQNSRLSKILVVSSTHEQFDEQYPSYTKILNKNYHLDQEFVGPNIWAGAFQKK